MPAALAHKSKPAVRLRVSDVLCTTPLDSEVRVCHSESGWQCTTGPARPSLRVRVGGREPTLAQLERAGSHGALVRARPALDSQSAAPTRVQYT